MPAIRMSSQRRPLLRDVKDHVTCRLCNGYVIDATTVTRCLHSFCRTCLTRHLASNKSCPTCGLLLCTDEMSAELRRDQTLQRLIYKMVPGLLTRELQRRRDFLQNCQSVSDVTVKSDLLPPDLHVMTSLYADSDDFSICLQLVGDGSVVSSAEPTRRRYLLCPASTSVGLLKKFICLKFALSDDEHSVEIFHAGELLEDFSTLMDVAYTFQWDRLEPLTLDYIVLRCSDINSMPTDGAAVRSPTANKDRKRKSMSLEDGGEAGAENSTATAGSPVQPELETKTSSGLGKQKSPSKSNQRRCKAKVRDKSSSCQTNHRSPQKTTSPNASENGTSPACKIVNPPADRKEIPESRDSLTPISSPKQKAAEEDRSVFSSHIPQKLPPASPHTAASKSKPEAGGGSDDDSCLSISTSVTVVISRRPPNSKTGNDVTGTPATNDCVAGLSADSRQIVVNTKIPNVSNFAFSTSANPPETESTVRHLESAARNPEIEEAASGKVATPSDGKSDIVQSREKTICSEASDVGKEKSADNSQKQSDRFSEVSVVRRGGLKRKSLESVIMSLKPTAVVAATVGSNSAVADKDVSQTSRQKPEGHVLPVAKATPCVPAVSHGTSKSTAAVPAHTLAAVGNYVPSVSKSGTKLMNSSRTGRQHPTFYRRDAGPSACRNKAPPVGGMASTFGENLSFFQRRSFCSVDTTNIRRFPQYFPPTDVARGPGSACREGRFYGTNLRPRHHHLMNAAAGYQARLAAMEHAAYASGGIPFPVGFATGYRGLASDIRMRAAEPNGYDAPLELTTKRVRK